MLCRAVIGLVDLNIAAIGKSSTCKVQYEVPIQG